MPSPGATDSGGSGKATQSTRGSGGLLLILAISTLAGLVAGCGQKGALYIPDTPAAAQRSTLPQTIFGTHKPADESSRESAEKAPAKP